MSRTTRSDRETAKTNAATAGAHGSSGAAVAGRIRGYYQGRAVDNATPPRALTRDEAFREEFALQALYLALREADDLSPGRLRSLVRRQRVLMPERFDRSDSATFMQDALLEMFNWTYGTWRASI